MKDKIDGVIWIDTDPEDDINYIEGLPPLERHYAVKYSLRYAIPSMLSALQRLYESIEALQDVNLLVGIIEKYEMFSPKTEKTRQLRLDIYAGMREEDGIYEDLGLSKPTWADYADFLAGEKGITGYKGKPYKAQTLRKIKTRGDKSLL